MLEISFNRLGHLVRRSYQIAQALFIGETAEMGLTPVQYAALNAVVMLPGIDQATLSRTIAFDKTTLVKVLDRLVDKGLITRVRSSSDRRRHLLTATDAGRAIEQAIVPMIDISQERLLAPLTDQEKATLMALLRRLVDAFPPRQEAAAGISACSTNHMDA